MNTTTESRTRVITLTNRRPVEIVEADWPEVASASYYDHDGKVECQVNRKWKGWLKVRKHQDGRCIVYGGASHSTTFRGEKAYDYRAGEVIEPVDGAVSDGVLVDTIHRVHQNINRNGITDRWSNLADECIADLPAESI